MRELCKKRAEGGGLSCSNFASIQTAADPLD